MELKILNQVNNELFDRKELMLETISNSTPKTVDVMASLAEKFSVPGEAISVKRIVSGFGHNKFSITANVYGSQESKIKAESQNKKQKAKTAA